MTKKIVWILLLLLLGAAGYWLFGKRSDEPGPPGGARRGFGGSGGPLPVQAATTKNGDIDIFIDGLGTVTARSTATVKPRVDGLLLRVPFREGQLIKAGGLLAEIDPRPFQVVLDQARGQLLRDQALLDAARQDLARYRGLLAQDSIARQQVDNQEALVRQYEGVVKLDRAQVEGAQLNLGFTHITAPVTGIPGLRQIDPGNMIHAADATGLVVITQTRPIYVIFAIPADSIGTVSAQVRAGKTLAVDALDRDGKTRLASGKLLTMDNQIDVATGTVKLKAEFANTDDKLFPNQFVNARLRVETRHGAVLMPVAAIQRGTRGSFVYVIGQDQAVSVRPVVLGPISGETVAVEQGLAAGEQVVTDGADKLREGAKVVVAIPGAGNAPAAQPQAAVGGSAAGSAEERQKRWAELDARIDRGEFGEEIRKLPEEERKQRMREMRQSRQSAGAGGLGSR